MDRLTARDNEWPKHIICNQMCANHLVKCKSQKDIDICQMYVAYEKLAEYEDAKEQGLLFRAPCVIGDDVYLYATDRILVDKMYKETWFLSREEAEQKLKEMEND